MNNFGDKIKYFQIPLKIMNILFYLLFEDGK